MTGTMLELAVLTGGNETEMVAALLAGYELTGNFKGHEAEVVAGLTETEEAEAV
jgi:hypothetical protein